MNYEHAKNQKNSTLIAARIFHSMRPLIEAAIGLMPQEATPRKLMRELQQSQFKEMEDSFSNVEFDTEDNVEFDTEDNVEVDTFDTEDNEDFDLDFYQGRDQTSYVDGHRKVKKGKIFKGRKKRKAEIGMKRGRKPQTYRCNGIEKTLAEWSKETGLSYGTLIKRLKEGVDITAPKKKRGRKKNASQNMRPKVTSLSEANDFFEKEKQQTNECALGRKGKNQAITIHNITKSLREWSLESGVSVSTIMARLARGWTAERAITSAPMMRGRRGPKAIKALSNHLPIEPVSLKLAPKVILRKKSSLEDVPLLSNGIS